MSYKRVLLKLSGEAFAGKGQTGIDEQALNVVKREIESILELNVETALVIGGGNFLRGSTVPFLHRAVADQMGMLSLIMNGLALREVLTNAGVPVLLQSAVPTPWTDPVSPLHAKEALSEGDVVIFTGGTGNPYVTTDTASAIRALEIDADVILKATQVDGVYTSDPNKDSSAQKLDKITFDEVINQRLEVMDMAAFDLCRANKLPIVVFDFYTEGNLKCVLSGEEIGTLVSG